MELSISDRQKISHIQNLSRGYNLNLDNIAVQGTQLLTEFDSANYSVRSTKVFFVFTLFLDDKIIVWPWARILSSKNNINMGHFC